MKKIVCLTFLFFSNLSYSLDIIAAGDLAVCTEKYEHGIKTVSTIIEKQSFDMFIPLGDLVYESATQEKIDNCYHKYLGKFKNKTYPIIGNHEYYAENGKHYFNYFQENLSFILKENDFSKDIENTVFPSYYYFEKNNWNFIFLDSNLTQEKHKKQLEWLKNIISSDKYKNKCSLVSFHHPYISMGLRKIVQPSKDFMYIFNNHPPTLILNGHDHHYQDSKIINKTKHFIVGTGGTPIFQYLNYFNMDYENYSLEHGILKLNLQKNSYSYQFINNEKTIVSGNYNCFIN